MNKLTKTEKFIKILRTIHGNHYDYSSVEYNHKYDNIKVICPEHGPFHIEARQHRAGERCPDCRGFKVNQPAYLYYYKIYNPSKKEIYYKIGVTNRTCQNRINDIQFSTGWKTEILLEIKMHGTRAYDTEQYIIKNYNKHCSGPAAMLIMDEGYTETFDYNVLHYDDVVNEIVENASPLQ